MRLPQRPAASAGPAAARYGAQHECTHERRLPCVRVPDQRDPELIATRGPTLVVVSLDVLELLFQLREAIADLAAIEIETGLARAGALLPPAARRGLPQARRDSGEYSSIRPKDCSAVRPLLVDRSLPQQFALENGFLHLSDKTARGGTFGGRAASPPLRSKTLTTYRSTRFSASSSLPGHGRCRVPRRSAGRRRSRPGDR
jgi:hypothetical protein